MPPQAIELTQEALRLLLRLSVPIGLVALAVSLIVAVLQTATQIHDATLGHLPRLLAIALGLSLLGPWMGRELLTFAARGFLGG